MIDMKKVALRIFNGFKEADKDYDEEVLNMTPEERMAFMEN